MLAVTLTHVVQDVTQRGRHLSGQVDAGVVTGQHLHQLWQQLIAFHHNKSKMHKEQATGTACGPNGKGSVRTDVKVQLRVV